MLSVNYAECRKQAVYAECRFAECRYAERRGAAKTTWINMSAYFSGASEEKEMFCNIATGPVSFRISPIHV